MRYIMGDVHGCYAEYQKLLQKIDLQEEDELYVLGDAMDRGPEPIRVMQDLMKRPNVIYILGNHDLAFYMLMKKLCVEITEENLETQLDMDLLLRYQGWMADGGKTTAEQFRKLSMAEKEDMLSFIEESDAYDVIGHEEKTFILVHGNLYGFSEDKDLDEYELADFVDGRPDYGRRYFSDENTYLVTGHTPTTGIEGWERAEVYEKNGHIALDCGCVWSGVLAAYCVETGEVFYSE